MNINNYVNKGSWIYHIGDTLEGWICQVQLFFLLLFDKRFPLARKKMYVAVNIQFIELW